MKAKNAIINNSKIRLPKNCMKLKHPSRPHIHKASIFATHMSLSRTSKCSADVKITLEHTSVMPFYSAKKGCKEQQTRRSKSRAPHASERSAKTRVHASRRPYSRFDYIIAFYTLSSARPQTRSSGCYFFLFRFISGLVFLCGYVGMQGNSTS